MKLAVPTTGPKNISDAKDIKRLLIALLCAILTVTVAPVLLDKWLFAAPTAVLAIPGAASSSNANGAIDLASVSLGQPLRTLDADWPQPAIHTLPHEIQDSGFDLSVALTNFTLQEPGSVGDSTSAQGYLQLYINGRMVQRLVTPSMHVESEWLTDGVNDIAVTLNAPDGAFWTQDDIIVMDSLQVAMPTAGAGSAVAGQVAYQLDWTWGSAEPLAEGGWVVTNDLGFRIQVRQGYAVTGSTEMVACPHLHNTLPLSNVRAYVRQIFGPAVAYAGHGSTANASRLTKPLVESLAQPVTYTFTAHFDNEPFYCQAHYLVAHGVETADQLPSDVNMIGKSLYLAGEYWSPDDDTATPFTIESDLAWGALQTVTSAAAQQDQPVALAYGEDAQITLTRNVGAIFDGVDFAQMGNEEQARTVLRNLTKSVTVKAALVAK